MDDLALRLSGLEATFEVVEAHVREGLSTGTEARLRLRLRPDQSLDPEAAIGKPVVLEIFEGDTAVRAFHLVVDEMTDDADAPGDWGRTFEAALRDRFAMLDLRRDQRIFQEKTSVDIVKEVFAGAGIDAETTVFHVDRTLPKRNYCVQYRETDRDFVERLLDFEGIFAVPADEPDSAKTIFADVGAAFTPIDGDATMPLVDSGMGSGISDLEVSYTTITEEVVIRDYNYETPGVDLTSTASAGKRSQRFEFPGGFQVPSDGDALAQIRLEEHLARRVVARGVAPIPRLRPGRTFDLTQATRPELNVTWLVRAAVHRYRLGNAGRPYVCEFEASFADQPFRPARRHAQPVVPGSHCAKVCGPSGEEVHTEALGRMKGKFFWDRVGKEDDRSTCWMRVVQLPIGGSQALARVGWEMIVRYVFGDPDRPIAVARVDNGVHRSPYGYPKAASSMSFKTLSSPGSGKFNEFTMEDGGGGQKFGVTASKDWNEDVVNDKTQKVGANEKLDVGTSLELTVGGSQAIQIGGSRTATISSDAKISVTGDRTKSVGGSETITVSGSCSEKVGGGDTETVGGNLMHLAALGINRTSKGSATLTVGSLMLSAAGMGCGVMVAGAKSETVGGAKLVISGGAVTETIVGAGAVTVGGVMVHAAAGNRVATAKGTSKLVVGGLALIAAGSKFQMKAKKIKFTVAGTANLLGGGANVNLTPGTATFLGIVTIKGGSVVKLSGNPNMIT